MDTKVTNTPLEVVLNDGTKITIPVGQTEGSITITNPKPNGGIVEYSITSATGGNYEALDKNSTTTIVTKDIVPPTVTITGSTVSESNTGTVTGNKTKGTVAISFNKPLTEDLTITLNNGQKIDFKVGDTTKTVEVPANTQVIVKGANKEEVGELAANIRGTRPPEPYKGKGIRYVGEYVRRKEGKTGK